MVGKSNPFLYIYLEKVKLCEIEDSASISSYSVSTGLMDLIRTALTPQKVRPVKNQMTCRPDRALRNGHTRKDYRVVCNSGLQRALT